MLYINNHDIFDPTVNLAIEEYALYHLNPDETYLLFYSMDPSIIVGKNQNTIEQINADFVEKNHVHVVRRLSGGGAVYNDRGDLSFCFITRKDGNHFNDYQKFTDPVVHALKELGVKAELSGRNDILVDGKKISGNAQFSTKDRMISHGTLLFDVNLDNVEAALRVRKDKIESKGIQSIRSRVTNIRDFLNRNITIEEFKQELLHFIFADTAQIPEYHLTDKDWNKIYEISDNRYRNWDWNYGRSPECNLTRSHRFEGGLVDVRIYIKNGLIHECKIYGDFFSREDIRLLEERLALCPYSRSEILTRLNGEDLSSYLSNVPEEAFLQLLCP